jgi:hypothetical protein
VTTAVSTVTAAIAAVCNESRASAAIPSFFFHAPSGNFAFGGHHFQEAWAAHGVFSDPLGYGCFFGDYFSVNAGDIA